MSPHIPNLDPAHLRAIVDMGSNGIRFSITNLAPPTARIMPTLYQHRAGISLYDAQYSATGIRQPIDEHTITAVITAFKHFGQVCDDFSVRGENVTVLATEATRTAINSTEFRGRIRDATGWEVTMLSKEDEGRIGALGIASSLPVVEGLVMDLGGGSTQLSWLVSGAFGKVEMPDAGAVSMPYGAAAMSRRLVEAEREGKVEGLRGEVRRALRDAYDSLNFPDRLKEVAAQEGGLTLYLSGGGFRGWGYVLMSRHPVHPYPIPVINGFKASRDQFLGTEEVKLAAASTLAGEDDEIFRVSDRRASQVPAVAFLINALADVLPEIKEVRFCQGGVREGYLFRSLLEPEKSLRHPLEVATEHYTSKSFRETVRFLWTAFPVNRAEGPQIPTIDASVIRAFANLILYYDTHSKDLQSSAALRSTTSGLLAGVHGLLHEHRTLLALLLCARWGGDVPPTDQAFKQSLEKLVDSPITLWWIKYLGAIAALYAAVHPTGPNHGRSGQRIEIDTVWELSDTSSPVLWLRIGLAAEYSQLEMVAKEIKDVEKVGKKKNWIGGKEGVGYKIVVDTTMYLPEDWVLYVKRHRQ